MLKHYNNTNLLRKGFYRDNMYIILFLVREGQGHLKSISNK